MMDKILEFSENLSKMVSEIEADKKIRIDNIKKNFNLDIEGYNLGLFCSKIEYPYFKYIMGDVVEIVGDKALKRGAYIFFDRSLEVMNLQVNVIPVERTLSTNFNLFK